MVVNDTFSFSPPMCSDHVNITNFTSQDPHLSNPPNPFNLWLLCGTNGSCSDLSPFSMIQGGSVSQGPSVFNLNRFFEDSLQQTASVANRTFKPTPVCVWPPFVFILTSQEVNNTLLFCTNNTCFYSLCWNATQFSSALVARLPRFVPVPVDAPSALTLYRPRRDFGITAAIVAAIGLAVAAASAAAVSLSTSVQTAHALNNLSAGVATALSTQVNVNSQLKGGIMLLNQRIDLLQEQADLTLQLVQLGCERNLPGLCITSIPYNNLSRAANLSRNLSHALTGEWTADFEVLLRDLQQSIVFINSTRVDVTVAGGLSEWVSQVSTHVREWAGVAAATGLLAFIAILGLMCIVRMARQNQRNQLMLMQAFAALEQGQNPQVWLAMMRV